MQLECYWVHLCKQETYFVVVKFHRLHWVGGWGCSFGVFRRCSASALSLNDLQVCCNWVTLQWGDGCLVSHHSRSLAGGGLWKGFYQAQWLQYERHSLMCGDSFRAEYVCTAHSYSIWAKSVHRDTHCQCVQCCYQVLINESWKLLRWCMQTWMLVVRRHLCKRHI